MNGAKTLSQKLILSVALLVLGSLLATTLAVTEIQADQPEPPWQGDSTFDPLIIIPPDSSSAFQGEQDSDTESVFADLILWAFDVVF